FGEPGYAGEDVVAPHCAEDGCCRPGRMSSDPLEPVTYRDRIDHPKRAKPIAERVDFSTPGRRWRKPQTAPFREGGRGGRAKKKAMRLELSSPSALPPLCTVTKASLASSKPPSTSSSSQRWTSASRNSGRRTVHPAGAERVVRGRCGSTATACGRGTCGVLRGRAAQGRRCSSSAYVAIAASLALMS